MYTLCSLILNTTTLINTCSTNVQLLYFLSPAASTHMTLMEIENELREITVEDWFPLGIQLGLRPATLRGIQKKYHRHTERCKEMLDLWLHNAPEVSWKSLAQAVEALGRYTSLAQKLRRRISPVPKGWCDVSDNRQLQLCMFILGKLGIMKSCQLLVSRFYCQIFLSSSGNLTRIDVTSLPKVVKNGNVGGPLKICHNF